MDKLLDIRNLWISLGTEYKTVPIIRGFEISVNEGEIVGILGESGSGKTVSSRMIASLFEKDESTVDKGDISFKGMDILSLGEKDMNRIRGREISYIFQNPSKSLNPYKKTGRQLEDFMKLHEIAYDRDTIINAMTEVGLESPETVMEMYPFQLSGGQNQRIMICQSILGRPNLLIADEPTSSIDAMLRKKILKLLIDVNRKYNTAIIFITHDFDVARFICQRLVIMYGGMVVEEGSLGRILDNPMHPYTEELIKCSRSLDSGDERLYSLEGTPLVPYEFKDECPFISRCRFSERSCGEGIPEMIEIDDGRTRCPIRAGKGGKDA